MSTADQVIEIVDTLRHGPDAEVLASREDAARVLRAFLDVIDALAGRVGGVRRARLLVAMALQDTDAPRARRRTA